MPGIIKQPWWASGNTARPKTTPSNTEQPAATSDNAERRNTTSGGIGQLTKTSSEVEQPTTNPEHDELNQSTRRMVRLLNDEFRLQSLLEKCKLEISRRSETSIEDLQKQKFDHEEAAKRCEIEIAKREKTRDHELQAKKVGLEGAVEHNQKEQDDLKAALSTEDEVEAIRELEREAMFKDPEEWDDLIAGLLREH